MWGKSAHVRRRICFEYSCRGKVPISGPPQEWRRVQSTFASNCTTRRNLGHHQTPGSCPALAKNQRTWGTFSVSLHLCHQPRVAFSISLSSYFVRQPGIASVRWLRNSTGLARHDFVVADKKLCRAGVRAADHRNQAGDLLACDQPEYAAAWAGQHCPKRIRAHSILARVLKNEDSSRLHLFRDPLIQDIDFRDHVHPPVSAIEDPAKIRFLSPIAAGVAGFTLRIHATALVSRLPNAFPHDLLLEAARPRFPSPATPGFPPVFLPGFAARCHSGTQLRLADENS